MTHDERRLDLDDTDIYEVGQIAPAPRPAPEMAAQPAPPAARTPPAEPIHPPARAPTKNVPPATPALAQRRPAAPAPSGWQAPYDTSSLAVLAATTLLVYGILQAIGFGFALAIWDAVARLRIGSLIQVRTVESTQIVFVTLLVIAIVQIAASVGVFAHRRWARWTAIAISVPGTIVGTLLFIVGSNRGLAIETWLGALLLGGYGFSFFALVAGNSHFRRIVRR